MSRKLLVASATALTVLWSPLAIGIVALGCVLTGASRSSAQGPYYPLPAWDQKLPANTRFVRVFFQEVCVNNRCAQLAQAILDQETGLVWERSPSSLVMNWRIAQGHCATAVHASRMGWRLPTVAELTSLLDPSVEFGVRLPPGHPFLNISGETHYWTATPDETFAAFHFTVDVDHPQVGSVSDSDGFFAWCVRGGAK